MKENDQIVICDDDVLAARRLAQIIRQILNELEKDQEILIFSDGQDFLNQAKEGQIVFLDVDMPQMDGMEVGRRLRERGLECPIIIETGFVDRFKEAFEIGAFRYVTKEYDAGEIRRALEAVFDEEPGSEKMEWFDNRVKLEIRMRDIDVVRAYNSYVLTEVKGRIFRREISLVRLEKELDPRLFVRINKSEIVNMARVTRLDLKKGRIFLGEKEYCVSERCRKNFEEKMLCFDLYGRQKIR